MITTNDYCQKEYGSKLYKISFDAGFTCPNRDGKCGTGGCIFCSEGGSGDFAVKLSRNLDAADIDSQIELAKSKVAAKYKGDKYIAYFQAFSNTYAEVSTLEEIYFPIAKRDDIAVISIATRPDCLSDDIYDFLSLLSSIKPVWVELGLQTTKPETVKYIRRGYDNELYYDAVKKLNSIGIHTITHVILYLPGESADDMKTTVRDAIAAGTKGIKLQLLHILKNTDLANDYYEKPFYIPTLDEYANTVKECLELCPDETVIHRYTGDAPKRLLIAPLWSANKKLVLNTIEETINPPEPYFVYMLKCGDNSIYTGSTNNVLKRFQKHASGNGCRYTSSHQPVELIYVEKCRSKRAALQREYAIKQLPRKAKLELIDLPANIIDDKEQYINDNNYQG